MTGFLNYIFLYFEPTTIKTKKDVQAWIEERKKKYPTMKKVADQGEKKRKRDLVTMEETLSSHVHPTEMVPTKKHQPTASCYEKTIHGKRYESVTKDTTVSKERSALASLLDYGSSSSDDEKEEKVVNASAEGRTTNLDPVTENKRDIKDIVDSMIHTPGSRFRTRHCKFFLQHGSCRHGDQCAFIHDSEARKDYIETLEMKRKEQSVRDKAKRKGSQSTVKNHQNMNSDGNKSLLRKLLDHDMRRERCLSLQLLRHIVDSNYMQPKKISLESIP